MCQQMAVQTLVIQHILFTQWDILLLAGETIERQSYGGIIPQFVTYFLVLLSFYDTDSNSCSSSLRCARMNKSMPNADISTLLKC